MFRLLILEESDIDAVIIRDIDSVVSERDAQFVNEWLKSDRNVHRYYCELYS